jgi:hypothetical protein
MQHALNTDVLVNVWPMDAVTGSDKPEILPLCRRRIGESPRPRQRDTDDSTVGEVCDDLAFCDPYVVNRGLNGRRSGHATPP